MTTVHDLMVYLSGIPGDIEIKVIDTWDEGAPNWVDLKLMDTFGYSDNMEIRNISGKLFLLLGEK
jgi:hypothetical protein